MTDKAKNIVLELIDKKHESKHEINKNKQFSLNNEVLILQSQLKTELSDVEYNTFLNQCNQMLAIY